MKKQSLGVVAAAVGLLPEETMSQFQLGRALTLEDADDLVASLKTLTGEFK